MSYGARVNGFLIRTNTPLLPKLSAVLLHLHNPATRIGLPETAEM